MPRIPPGQLTALNCDEVALVDKAANKRRFILLKATEDEMDPRITQVIETLKITDQDQQERLAKALTPLIETVKDDAQLLRVAKAIVTDTPDEDQRITKALAGITLADERREAVVKALTPVLPVVTDDAQLRRVAKSLAGVDTVDEPNETDKVIKSLNERIAKLEKADNAGADETVRETLTLLRAMRDDRTSALAEQAELRKRLDAEVQLRKDRELEQRIDKDFSGLPVGRAELLRTLKAIEGIEDDGARAAAEDVLKTASKTIETSELFSSIGGRGRSSSSVMGEVRAQANQIAKAENVAVEKALDLVLDRDPELAKRYLAEVRGDA